MSSRNRSEKPENLAKALKVSQGFRVGSKRVLVLALLSLLLVACQSGESAATPLPTLAPGKAMVIGRVVTDETGQPLRKRPVLLAEVYRQGDQAVFALNPALSLSSYTDQQGRFAIVNIDPKEYVIFVGDPYSSDYEIIAESPDQARIWKLEADKTLDVGELRVWFGP